MEKKILFFQGKKVYFSVQIFKAFQGKIVIELSQQDHLSLLIPVSFKHLFFHANTTDYLKNTNKQKTTFVFMSETKKIYLNIMT